MFYKAQDATGPLDGIGCETRNLDRVERWGLFKNKNRLFQEVQEACRPTRIVQEKVSGGPQRVHGVSGKCLGRVQGVLGCI